MSQWLPKWFLGTLAIWVWVVPGASTATCVTFCWTAVCIFAMLLDAGGKARREAKPPWDPGEWHSNQGDFLKHGSAGKTSKQGRMVH